MILLQSIFHSDFDDLVILWNKCWKKKKIVKDIGDVKPLPANWETATAPMKHYTVMPRWKLQCDDDDY